MTSGGRADLTTMFGLIPLGQYFIGGDFVGKYTQKDAKKETDATTKEAKSAWHTARDDAAKEGGWGVPEDRHSKEEKEKK